jgi:hypothetical protein
LAAAAALRRNAKREKYLRRSHLKVSAKTQRPPTVPLFGTQRRLIMREFHEISRLFFSCQLT